MRLSRLALVALSLTPSIAFAQEAAAAEPEGGLLTPSGGLMVWTLVIFGVLLFVLSKMVLPKILKAVEDRERALEEAIAAAKADREAAAKLLAEHRRQLEAARDEAQKFIADARAVSEKMRADMLEETHRQQQEILQRARAEIEAEKEKAIAQMRRESIDLAIAGASKVLERNLDDQANRKLVESFLASLGDGKAKAGK